MIQLSIIIPVYNVQAYLEECLNSIVNQNIDNFEIIVINDGSTDGSEDIIDKFTRRYKFIKKVNKKNGGPGAARNIGIKLAAGKYIGFIDSDDYIEKNMFKNMLDIAEKTDSDIIMCDVELFKDNEREKKWYLSTKKKNYNKIINNEDVLKLYLSDRIKGFAWNKIYKRSIFIENNIVYEEGVYYEDIYMSLILFTYAKKIYLVNKAYYKYRQRDGNITSGITEKHLEDYNNNTKKSINFMNENKLFEELTDYKKAFEVSFMNSILELYYKHFNFNTKKINENYYKYFNEYNYDISYKDIFFKSALNSEHKKKYILNKFGIYVYIMKYKSMIKKLLINKNLESKVNKGIGL